MDAYVQATIGSKKIKTKTITTVEDKAEWNETLWIPVRMPIMTGKLILAVRDYDLDGDEQAGALIFDYKELLARPDKDVFWANIYGAPG